MDPFVAEVRILACNFAPKGWALCNGQLMSISQNTALFSLLGTNYGGDGKATFGLPNFQGSVPIGQGQGPGLTDRTLGETGGSTTVTLLESEMPPHTHTMMAETQPSNSKIPNNTMAIGRSVGGNAYLAPDPNLGQMATNPINPQGSSLPHNNLMPYLTLNFCIALQGVFPPRG
jgi:microcystin-dependent protein